jgi:hypothetical protein
MNDLSQEKIYVTKESDNSELLTINEFLQELGFEIPLDQPQSFTQENVEKLVAQSSVLRNRFSYKTLSIVRDSSSGLIVWEREILGIKVKTTFEDCYPKEAIVVAADQIETCFREEMFGKSFVIVGDYEYQSYILDKEKRRYIVNSPENFTKYNVKNKEPRYTHPWYGSLETAEFIPTFVGQILVNYIVLREAGVPSKDIKINVGSDGSMQTGGGRLSLCPAIIPSEDVQKVILDNLIEAIDKYANGSIDEIALMQAKALNRFNEKSAMMKSIPKKV